MNDVCKDFKVLNRREGLKGSLLDLFSHNYKTVNAVSHISMEIGQGEIVGYLGPNGAGKSTTIKMMTGVLEPSSGEILVNNIVPYKKREKNARNIGVVFGQRTQLWWALPVIESFKIIRDIYQVSNKDYNDMLELYASLLDISSLLHKPVREMSLGQRTLCDILAAFIHNPDIVFLDEPTIGLDVSMKSKIREFIKALNEKKNTTVILTTHDMGDVDALCQRVVIIDKGCKLYDDDIDKLKVHFGAYRSLNVQLKRDVNELTKEAMDKLTTKLYQELSSKFSKEGIVSITAQDEWAQILVNEDVISVIDILNAIQSSYKIYDMKLNDISTESIIKKIYEGGFDT